jgi:MerR family transcriptional regulator/heat shock protein HspR
MNQPSSTSANVRAQRTEVPAQVRFYSVEIVALLSGVPVPTIRRYERLGLVEPERTLSGLRRYSDRDVERVRQIRRLCHDLGVNLAAVEVILHMRERMLEMRREVFELKRQLGLE